MLIGLQTDLGPHQPQQRVDIVALAQQQGKLLFLKGRQQPLRELLALYRCDTDGGVLLGACPEDWDDQPAAITGQRPSEAGVDADLVGRSNAGYACEVHGLVVARSSNVEQQLLRNAIRCGRVICLDNTVESERRSTTRYSYRKQTHGQPDQRG